MSIPVTLTIAGSDSSAGAGIQADLKTFSHLGCHGLTAVTCIVAESPELVVSIHPVPLTVLQEQIEILLSSYPIAAAKTGMLYSKPHLVAATEILAKTDIPLVVDPVMIATSGANLLDRYAIAAYKERLFPIAALITPNLPEAEVLLDQEIPDLTAMQAAAQKLAETYQTSCLLKGGHLPNSCDSVDVLWHHGEAHQFRANIIDIPSTHGTGCTLSAAITAQLANGLNMVDAVRTAKQWTHRAIEKSFHWKSPNGSTIYALNQIDL